ncbi:MAG: hypothetical protein DRG30_01145 [Epsilonproteobacteria bacterium]|nr:MAG: hypothetical protein DRG30_01145 [Campylobacterota bacterium]
MSTSKQVSIANSALLKVGATRINSFDDNKNEAVIIKEFYERSYRALLSMYPWSFAMKTVALAQLPTKPLAEYEYAYALPNDLVWLQRTHPNSNFKILGRELHTNERTVSIKYTYRCPEEDMSIQFEQAFMYYLASQICIPITENIKKDELLYVQYQDHLKRAKSITAQQQPQDGFEDFPVDNSRYGA